MPFETQQDSFNATKGAILNSHSMPDVQEGPGLAGQSGFNNGLNGGNFSLLNGDGSSASSDHVDDPRDR